MIRLNFEIHGVTTWFTNSYNTHTGQYLTNKGNQTMTFGQVIEYNKRNISLQKLYQKWGKETNTFYSITLNKAIENFSFSSKN